MQQTERGPRVVDPQPGKVFKDEFGCRYEITEVSSRFVGYDLSDPNGISEIDRAPVNFKMTIGEWRKLVKRGWLYAAD